MFSRSKTLRLTLAITALTLAATSTEAQQDPKVLKDLGTVIILQGYPCGKAVSADKRGEDDYLVTCQSGDRYRVTIDANDRVVIKKQ